MDDFNFYIFDVERKSEFVIIFWGLETFPAAPPNQTSTWTVYFSLQSSLKSFVAEEDLAKLVGRRANVLHGVGKF